MKTINSVSGGKTSSFIAANYLADLNLFSLVRTEDKNCLFPDSKIRQIVEDRIQKPFVGTLEDDLIIYTILDLEQFIGQEIKIVSGETYDQIIQKKGGWLPNKLHRYCTTFLKIEPMFKFWLDNFEEPVEMRIGFRANETSRMQTMIEKTDENGFLSYKWTTEKLKDGRNKWKQIPWQKPTFPLIEKRTFKDEIEKFWKDKPVRFAEFNNCVGCFHRNPILLHRMFEKHSNKMNWFLCAEKNEKNKSGTWRSDVSYEQIKNFKKQLTIEFDQYDTCDSGFCENE
jgi:hypothetical protein